MEVEDIGSQWTGRAKHWFSQGPCQRLGKDPSFPRHEGAGCLSVGFSELGPLTRTEESGSQWEGRILDMLV